MIAERVFTANINGENLTIQTNINNLVKVKTNVCKYYKGDKNYKLIDHLGNVLSVINDRITPKSIDAITTARFEANIASINEYDPFRMQIIRSPQSSPISRYGFNGKEKEDEHTQGKYDFGARIYDARLGRWLAIDPMSQLYPMLSPFSGFGNNPILYTDPDGKLLRDSEGNLIVISTGKLVTKEIYVGGDKETGQVIIAKVTYEVVYLKANDGSDILAHRKVSAEYVARDAYGNEQIIDDAKSLAFLDSKLDLTSNCHGVSLANGELTIFAADVKDVLMDEAEFETVPKDKAEIVVFSDKKGNTGSHSAKKDGDNYTSSDGAKKTVKGDLKSASSQGKYVNPIFKKEIKKISSAYDGGAEKPKNGIRMITQKQYEGRTAEDDYNKKNQVKK